MRSSIILSLVACGAMLVGGCRGNRCSWLGDCEIYREDCIDHVCVPFVPCTSHADCEIDEACEDWGDVNYCRPASRCGPAMPCPDRGCSGIGDAIICTPIELTCDERGTCVSDGT